MNDPECWIAPPRAIPLSSGQIHLCRTRLDLQQDTLRRLRTYLSPDEIVRAGRFRFPRDRDHFTAARGILRDLLARFLGCVPASICFSQGPNGKPSLSQKWSKNQLFFNVSHSHGWALYVFGNGRELGVDIEKIREEIDATKIAERYFSLREREEFRLLPHDLQPEAFFLCWTRKEAYVKARGLGLQIPLDSFDVSLTPSEPATLCSQDRERWELRSFHPIKGFVAALVSEGKIEKMRFWDYHEHSRVLLVDDRMPTHSPEGKSSG